MLTLLLFQNRVKLVPVTTPYNGMATIKAKLVSSDELTNYYWRFFQTLDLYHSDIELNLRSTHNSNIIVTNLITARQRVPRAIIFSYYRLRQVQKEVS